MSKCIVTGATGYIGSRVVGPLAERGWDVHALVREREDWLGPPQTALDLASAAASEELGEVCDGAEVVVHLAGENEVLASRDPAAALAATLTAAENVAEACAASGVRRVLYMSTVHVYGARIAPGVTLTEEMRAEPRSAYAISRLASEHVAAALAAGRYELVIFRLTNSVGAPAHPSVDRWTLVANDLCRQAAIEGRMRLKSSGSQWRDFIPLSAVCSAIVAAAGPELSPGTYNLGSGGSRTVRSLAEMIQQSFAAETGSAPELIAPALEADPPGPYEVSIDKAREGGLTLQEELETAVTETVRFCLHHREELASERHS